MYYVQISYIKQRNRLTLAFPVDSFVSPCSMTPACSGRGLIAELMGGAIFAAGVETNCRGPTLVGGEGEDGARSRDRGTSSWSTFTLEPCAFSRRIIQSRPVVQYMEGDWYLVDGEWGTPLLVYFSISRVIAPTGSRRGTLSPVTTHARFLTGTSRWRLRGHWEVGKEARLTYYEGGEKSKICYPLLEAGWVYVGSLCVTTSSMFDASSDSV